MPASLDLKRLLRPGAQPVAGSARFDLSGCDFLDFSVPQPVTLDWRAEPTGASVRLSLHLAADYEAECVRCLTPFTGRIEADKVYSMVPADLEGEFPEYPPAPDGGLDLFQMAYGEVVLEAPTVPVCDEDCAGLCGVCGQKKPCGCEADAGGMSAASEAGEPPAPDPRWNALRALLNDGDVDENPGEK